ncbi:MAG: exostosin family protein [Leptolyngbyaceae cyanobacterium bins.59]|nr:exostosin family protein [Leptolyngbyaceae cyanobacterium bins.59]
MHKLKVYTEDNTSAALKNIPLEPMVHPFFKERITNVNKRNLDALRYDRYWHAPSSPFTFSCLEECDLVILPYDWYWVRGPHWKYPVNSPVAKEVKRINTQLYYKAREYQKPVAVFFRGDRSHESIPLKEAIVFREGLYQSRRSAHDFALPAFSEDIAPQWSSQHTNIRPKQPKPTVGFCGLVGTWKLKQLAGLGAYQALMLATQGRLDASPYKGEILRTKALATLQQHQGIETNFILRQESVFLGRADDESREKHRNEYVQNLRSSDYILCCRGSGNFSFRFYETLCMGRIPVLINTDCVLPFDSQIDWRNHAVWVEEKELHRLPEKILEFHNSLSPQEFTNLQIECRRLWEKWLAPEGFFANFYHHFEPLLSHHLIRL